MTSFRDLPTLGAEADGLRGDDKPDPPRPNGSFPNHLIDLSAPYATAREFRDAHCRKGNLPVLYYHRGSFYLWNNSCYPTLPDDELRAQIYSFLDHCVTEGKNGLVAPVKPNITRVNQVIDALKAVALLPQSTVAPIWLDPQAGDPDPMQVIACSNVLLDLARMKEFRHTPSFFTYNALDFQYDANALKPVAWLKFLCEIWEKDDEAISTLQEIFGYCLTADTSQQKCFMLVGPKRSGKGTIVRVLGRLLGSSNVAAPTLASLGQTFGLEPLIDKRLAMISDARLGTRNFDLHTIVERLLSITGEDAITIGRKYKAAWTGSLATRVLILTNELPRFADASGALASRFILLVMTKSFYGREDPKLTDKLLDELPGILNWAIEGWRRLQRRGYFMTPKSAVAVARELEELGSPISAFVRRRCRVWSGLMVQVDDLYDEWRRFCETQGRKFVSNKQHFGRDLRSVVPGLKVVQPRTTGPRLRWYQGIDLKEPLDWDDDEETDAMEA